MRSALLVAGRQARAALADPGPSIALPMMPSLLMLVVFTSVFDSIAQVEGYDTSAFTTSGFDGYVVPGIIVLVALLGAGYTSSSLAADVRSGYAERLRLAGVGVWPQILGRLLVEALRLLPGLLVAIGVGMALGGEADNGAGGIAVVVALVSLLGVAFTGVFFVVAVASEDPQTPFTMQPLGLPLAFMSTALVPIAIMPDWSRAIARANPVSVVVDASRHAMVGELWSSELLAAVVALTAWILISQLASWWVFTTKIAGA